MAGIDGRSPSPGSCCGIRIETVKPILVAGEPLNLMRDWKRQVFYDQGGTLVRRLGIHRVPAVVTQDGKRLRVDEVLP